MTFSACLPIILKNEGGFVDNLADSGGATNLGITQGTLSNWLKRGATIDEVKALTPEAVSPIYHDLYYVPSGAVSCPSGVDLIVFDTAVNMGTGIAARFLQNAVGVMADGHVGPITVSAIAHAAPGGLIDKICDARIARYRGLSNFNVFGAGWLSRVARTQNLALGMVQ